MSATPIRHQQGKRPEFRRPKHFALPVLSLSGFAVFTRLAGTYQMHLPYGMTNIETSPSNYNLGMVGYGDALVVPKPHPGIRRGAAVGVFEASGQYIRESGIERHWGHVTEPPNLNNDTAPDRYDEAAIFAGYIVNHFGHFTLESLARLWAFKNQNLPIVWASGSQLLPWQSDIFAHLGVSPDRMSF